jgi:membrane dipeptidase
MNGMARRPGPGGACPEGLRTTADWPALYAALAAHGVPQAALDHSGERLLHLFERVESRADPRARARAIRRPAMASRPFDIAE